MGCSRDELAERATLWLTRHDSDRREYAMDGNHLGKLERGAVSKPAPHYRAALRAVLGASDAELGFAPLLDADTADRVAAVQAEPQRVDTATITALASVLASLRRLEDETSAAAVLPSVQSHRQLVTRLAADADSTGRPAAVGLVSEIEQYLGWLAIPLGRWHESRAHLDRAAVHALEAADAERLSSALSFTAYGYLRRDDLAAADALSEAARRDPSVNIGLRTYETYQRAEVQARRGEHSSALALLAEADVMIDHLPDPADLPDAGYWYVPSFFTGQRAFVLRGLGDFTAARAAARECLAAMPAEWATSEWAARRRTLAE